ncbi:type VI secretion system protein VasD [Sinobacterium caligoides]|uniref:Type VI secretion system protein VasD n=1 Tax=Sinobacterium caligoides TaxID=933926 RepID=A0A3N2DL12_9GAMM|nr:type VI secretion system lipoprotein TssJ [Sinobacterium caligoides]ROS00035.1 type VI secretion system protein VasD [Sinobacterium caligoides]
MKRLNILLAAILISLVTTSCTKTRSMLNLDTVASFEIEASDNLNPDHDGRASPLTLRIYKLSDNRQFSREEFIDLYRNANQLLGNDLIDTIVLKELVPGEQRVETIELSSEVRFLGILAEYSQYEKSRNVISVPIVAHSKNKFELLTQEDAIVLKK